MTKEKLLPLLLDNRVLSNNQEKALRKLFKAIASAKNEDRDADDWFILGYVELADENADEAIDTFDFAIDLNPDFEAAYKFRASAYKMLGDYQQALRDATKAIELDENYLDAWYERASIHHNMKAFDKALEDTNKALGIEPEASYIRLLKARIMYDSGDYKNSISEFDTIIAEEPKNVDAIGARGLAYFFSDKPEEALADIRKARLLEGGSIVSEFNMGLVCSAIPEKSKEAFRHLEKAFRKDGKLLQHYIEHSDSEESERLISKLENIFESIKERREENFYTRELHDLLERKLRDARETNQKNE